MNARKRSGGQWFAGLAAVAFGLATLVEGGHVLFGGPEARAAAGNVVPFVLHFNFAAGFVYLAAGASALLGHRSAIGLARALALSSLVVLAALALHVATGGAFERRTPIAMTLRTLFWAAQALALPRMLRGTGELTRSPDQ